MLRHTVRLGAAILFGCALAYPAAAQTADTLAVTYGSPGAEPVTGTLVIRERMIEIDGRPALQRVLEFSGRPIGFRVDTAVDMWPAFEPHRFVSQGDFGMLDVQYADHRVLGTVRDPAGYVELDTVLAEPFINASSFDAFLRTLPPRPGLQFSVSAYSPRGGMLEYRGVIEGRDTLALRNGERREALRIAAVRDGGELTVWLDVTSGRLVRMRVPVNDRVIGWTR